MLGGHNNHREEGDIGLVITPVPKVLFDSLTTLGIFFAF